MEEKSCQQLMGHVQPQGFRSNSTLNSTSIWIRPGFGEILDTVNRCHADGAHEKDG